jgi:subtilisin family serine protease
MIDSGCDRAHPDLDVSAGGLDLDTFEGDGSPEGGDPHWTLCAGIIAARSDNDEGVAGIAGRCPSCP